MGSSEGFRSDCHVLSHTREWTPEILQHLKIQVERGKEYLPIQLLKQAFKTQIKEAERSGLKELIKKFTKKVQKVLGQFDVSDIEDIDKELAYSLLFERKHNMWHRNFDAWKIYPESLNRMEDWVYRRFDSYGENYARQLIQISLRKEDELLTESVYEGLFQQFAGIFGFESYSHTSLSTIKIGGTTVSSVPDIIFPHLATSGPGKVQLMAICKVKENYQCGESLGGQMATEEKKQDENNSVRNCDCFIGQIGGEFLVHYPFSQNDCGLFGLIIDKTLVTFVHFQCCDTDYDDIKTDGLSGVSHPVIKFSKPYNYLDKADREELIEPLLTLGVIQNMPYIT